MTEKTLNGIFIDVEVDEAVAQDPELAAKLEEVCPVDIFGTRDDGSLMFTPATSSYQSEKLAMLVIICSPP